MKINIVDNKNDPVASDGSVPNSKGGTELMKEELMNRLNPKYKDDFNIICSRVREVPKEKLNILWLHDLWNDPETLHLRDQDSLNRFKKLIFVSNYQMYTYHMGHGIPYSKCMVLRNAINVFDDDVLEKPNDGQIRLVYHTTPHRGLQILVPVFEKLYEFFGDKIVLDVFSSFDIYGWYQRNEPYEEIFERCRQHPGINYHGTVSNKEVREALVKSHIFAYPSIWQETSCISVIEAMSAGCAVICPNYGALPETTGNLATIYPWTEDNLEHANLFAQLLKVIIENYWNEAFQAKIRFTKAYADNLYDWNSRIYEWEALFDSILAKEGLRLPNKNNV